MLRGHQGWVFSVAFSADGKTLASGGGPQILMPEGKKRKHGVRLWNAATGQELRQFAGHRGAVGGLAFLAEGKILASISADSTIRFWEIATGKERYRLAMQPGSPSVLRPVSRWEDSGNRQ